MDFLFFETELDSHLAQKLTVNRKNSKSTKTIKSLNGSFELNTPRDRDGSFSPQMVAKHQTAISDELYWFSGNWKFSMSELTYSVKGDFYEKEALQLPA